MLKWIFILVNKNHYFGFYTSFIIRVVVYIFVQVVKNTFLLCRKLTTYDENNRIEENHGDCKEYYWTKMNFISLTFDKQALQLINMSRWFGC